MAMRAGVPVSVAAHVVVLVAAIIGLGQARQLEPATVESISVDLVPVSATASIRAGTLDSKIIDTQTPSVVKDTTPAQLAKPTGNTQEDQPKPQKSDTPTPRPSVNEAPKPVPNPAPQPVVPPAPAPKPTPTPTPASVPAPTPEPTPTPAPAPEPKPAPTSEPTPAPSDNSVPQLSATPTQASPADTAPRPVARSAAIAQKRAAFKKAELADKAKAEAAKTAAAAQAKQDAEAKKLALAKERQDKAARAADEISNLINDEKSSGATTGQGGTPTAGKESGKAASLSQSEIGALVAKIKSCWVLLPNEIESGLSVRLLVNLNEDGSVAGTPQVLEADASEMGGSIARAAQRAIVKCAPYSLAKAKYAEWKQLDVTLNASQ